MRQNATKADSFAAFSDLIWGNEAFELVGMGRWGKDCFTKRKSTKFFMPVIFRMLMGRWRWVEERNPAYMKRRNTAYGMMDGGVGKKCVYRIRRWYKFSLKNHIFADDGLC